MNDNTVGRKDDGGKVQLDLLSSSWILGVGQVLTFGAKKYASHNWRKGIARSRLLGACLRHVFAYLNGEDYDPETGLLHLYHASCCLMFASELHETNPETDDRWKTRKIDISKVISPTTGKIDLGDGKTLVWRAGAGGTGGPSSSAIVASNSSNDGPPTGTARDAPDPVCFVCENRRISYIGKTKRGLIYSLCFEHTQYKPNIEEKL